MNLTLALAEFVVKEAEELPVRPLFSASSKEMTRYIPKSSLMPQKLPLSR